MEARGIEPRSELESATTPTCVGDASLVSRTRRNAGLDHDKPLKTLARPVGAPGDRKSTRLNSSHLVISYAVFCLKKKKQESYQLFSLADCGQNQRCSPQLDRLLTARVISSLAPISTRWVARRFNQRRFKSLSTQV